MECIKLCSSKLFVLPVFVGTAFVGINTFNRQSLCV